MFDDQEYSSHRAETERRSADAAQDPRAAHAHLKLAELHDKARHKLGAVGGGPAFPAAEPM